MQDNQVTVTLAVRLLVCTCCLSTARMFISIIYERVYCDDHGSICGASVLHVVNLKH